MAKVFFIRRLELIFGISERVGMTSQLVHLFLSVFKYFSVEFFLKELLRVFGVIMQVLIEAEDRMGGRNFFDFVVVQGEWLAIELLEIILMCRQIFLVIRMIIL